MAIENLPNESGDSHLSGAYIRSFVKQLTTTTPTSKPYLNTTQNFTINNNDTLIVPNYDNNNPMTKTPTKKLAMAKPNHNQDLNTQGHKKQVRRRLHTSRPYQERLLNMAEARKEIVTALKFHRATMKQANDRKQQQQQQQQSNNQQQVSRDYNIYDNSSRKVKSEQLSVDNFSYHYQPSHNTRNYNQNYFPPSNIISSTTTTSPMYDSLSNIPLPNQTLGLNLNLQAFTNLDTNFCHNSNININTFTTTSNTTTTTSTSTNSHPSTVASPSSPSTPVSVTTTEAVGATSGDSSSSNNNNMHPCLGEEEIAKMRSIGEQYQIEWDDTLNLVKSAWWFKFLKTVDFGNNKDIKNCYYNNNTSNNNDHNIPPFKDELMEFPPWLSPSNDESFLHQQLDDSCSEDNTTLPWMDIEDINVMDDEWLS